MDQSLRKIVSMVVPSVREGTPYNKRSGPVKSGSKAPEMAAGLSDYDLEFITIK